MKQQKRPQVLVISGFDPSAGAGILADVKTIEFLKVYAFGIVSALTHQDDEQVYSISYNTLDDIFKQIDILFNKFNISTCKIGVTESVSILWRLISYLKLHNPDIKIIVDPVLKSSSGFSFHQVVLHEEWKQVLSGIYLLTPNSYEMQWLSGTDDGEAEAKKWSLLGNILLKGGHSHTKPGTDLLFQKGEIMQIDGRGQSLYPKHGSGCILSAAIAAFTALGMDLPTACKEGKKYIEKILNSNNSLLAYH